MQRTFPRTDAAPFRKIPITLRQHGPRSTLKPAADASLLHISNPSANLPFGAFPKRTPTDRRPTSDCLPGSAQIGKAPGGSGHPKAPGPKKTLARVRRQGRRPRPKLDPYSPVRRTSLNENETISSDSSCPESFPLLVTSSPTPRDAKSSASISGPCVIAE